MGVALAAIAVPALAGSAVVLEYHHVAADTPPSTSVTPATFEKHMDYLARNDFHVWSLPRLVKRVRAGEEVPPRTVAITFDDAYVSVYREAWPRLRARGWPFTVFVTPDYVDRDYAQVTNWTQLREMEAAGVTIANHSLTHPHMVARGDRDRASWLARMRKQIVAAQERLEQELDKPARLFAWPFGEFTPPLQSLLTELGFVGFGQQSGAFGRDSDFTALPRFPLAHGFASLDSFARKVNSRPLPVARVTPASGLVAADAERPWVELKLADGPFRPEQVHCYSGGTRAEIERVAGQPRRLRVRPGEALEVGRTKVNCTAPATDGDQWLWYSYLWMKPRPDGSWYEG